MVTDIKFDSYPVRKGLLLLLFLLVGASIPPAKSQSITGPLSKEAEISILTLGPAEPAYTIFGHTAIRLKDPVNSMDQVYNYGTFNVNVAHFYLKFLSGDLTYFLSKTDFKQFKERNTALGRSIVSQRLRLSQSHINKLAQTLEKNILPENRSYPYRFFRQNCVTQVHDILLEANIASSINKIQAKSLSASTFTYRQKIAPYLANRPWLQLAINLMLGANADQPSNDHKQPFLPSDLHLFLANAVDNSGNQWVESSQTIAKAQITDSQSPTPPILILWGLLLLIAAFTATSIIRGWRGWWIDRLLFGAVGIAGLIITFGSFVSHHPPLHHNWNLLWALPTHLFVAAKVQSFSRNKWLRLYFWLTLTLSGIVLIAGAALPQHLPTAVMPLIASLAIRSAYRLYLTPQYERS